MGRLFGTDGVRGVANTELTPELAFNLGKAGASVLGKNNEKPIVLIGKDTRISGDMLENALAAGIMAMGGNVIKAGVLPTPAIAYLVRYYQADAGAVISASHNPFEYNGIKFFNGEGFKLADEIEDEIENLMLRDIDLKARVEGDRLGKCLEGAEDATNAYVDFLAKTVRGDFSHMKIVLDCANGAAYQVAEMVFRRLGAQIKVIHNHPNGVNINQRCGSTHPQSLQDAVLEMGADCGLAFDGDADRLIAVDARGRLVDGDRLIYICAKALKEKKELKDKTVTATVMSNIGFHRALKKIGCRVDSTQVGDRYVLEQMLKTGCVIGGEQSGHIIFLNHTTTGDGILSALQLLQAVRDLGKSLEDLADEVTIYPQVLKNARVKTECKKTYMEDPVIKKEIERLERKMAGEGRVLIRPSGTEPLVRVMIEGQDLEKITHQAEQLAELIQQRLG